MIAMLRALVRNKRGATAIEYGLIVSLIVLGMMVAITNFAKVSINMWQEITNKSTGAHG